MSLHKIKNFVVQNLLKGSSQAAHQHLGFFNEPQLRRVLYFYQLFQKIKDVEGAVVECGVGQGRGLALLCSLIEAEGKDRALWGFDSFEGFPELTQEDQASSGFIEGLKEYQQFTIPYVLKTLAAFGISRGNIDRRISFAKGFIPDSLSLYDGKTIALLHLDLDIYQSYKDSLEFFWDKLASGGIVAFDEYFKAMDVVKWPGASQAINEFLDSQNLRSELCRDSLSGNAYLVKP